MISSSFNLVYFLHSAYTFQNGQTHCLFSVTCGQSVLIAFHTFFIYVYIRMLKSKEFTKCQNNASPSILNVYFFQLSSNFWKFHSIPPFQPEQEPEMILVALLLLLYSHCSLYVLHSGALHQPNLHISLPNKFFFTDTILSPLFL